LPELFFKHIHFDKLYDKKTIRKLRKKKLVKKRQKEGKKRMKSIGSVNVPSDVFIKMVARGD